MAVKFKKSFLLFCCLLFCVTFCVVPCMAAVQPPYDSYQYAYVYNPLPLDTFILSPGDIHVNIPSPFYQSIAGGYALEEYDEIEVMFREPNVSGGVEPEAQLFSVVPGSISSTSYGYDRSFTVDCDLFSSNYITFAFSNSDSFVCNADLLSVLSNGTMGIYPNVTWRIQCYMFGSVPIENENGYTMQEFSATVDVGATNNSAYIVPSPMFPYLADYNASVSGTSQKLYELVGDNDFVIESYYCEVTLSAPSSVNMGALQFVLPYVDIYSYPSISDFALEYGTPVIVESPFADGFGNFMKTVVGTFLDTQVAPFLTLGDILAGVLGIALFMAFVKIFAGG